MKLIFSNPKKVKFICNQSLKKQKIILLKFIKNNLNEIHPILYRNIKYVLFECTKFKSDDL
jgi:hypothetical protein